MALFRSDHGPISHMTYITSSFIQSGPWTNFTPGLILLVALFRPDHNISNGQKIVSNIYNNNKASNAKIGQNVNKTVYFFARFFHVNLVVWFDSILPKYTSVLLFSEINSSSEHHRELFVGCWSLMTSMGGNSHCNCSGLNNSNTKIK